jgi:hypothetical protein
MVMELPGIDDRPGRVVEAEIHRRFNLLVSFDPAASPKEFLLVVSFGYSKFCLTAVSVAHIL